MNSPNRRPLTPEIRTTFPNMVKRLTISPVNRKTRDALLFDIGNNRMVRFSRPKSKEASDMEVKFAKEAAEENIAPQIYKHKYENGILMIEMEKMDGDFFQLRNKYKGRDFEEPFRKVMNEIRSIIKTLNDELNICHGDLSGNPGNILYKDRNGEISFYIIDFTTARRKNKKETCPNSLSNNKYYPPKTNSKTNKNSPPTSIVRKLAF